MSVQSVVGFFLLTPPQEIGRVINYQVLLVAHSSVVGHCSG